jgi:5'-methylthioadenosine phosphorylase
MARLAVVGGHNLLGTDFAAAARRTEVPVDAGTVGVLDGGSYVVLQRHGLDEYVQPHRIDHVANMRALRELGCDRVLAIASVGSLRLDHPVGTFLAPHDFIALTSRPVAVSAGESGHLVPAFEPGWRARVLATWNDVREDGIVDRVVDRGVYWETTGPRFETPSEIRLLATFADVVGMTVGSECTAACGAGLAYAPVCIVDNLANGLGPAALTHDEFAAGTDANRARLLYELALVLPELVA